MNYHDSERIAGLLDESGLERTADEREADAVIVNTCSVRERAEDQLYTRLGEFRTQAAELGRRPVVVVTGCVAQQEGRRLVERDRSIDLVVGTQALKRLPHLIDGVTGRSGPGLAPAHVVDINPYEDVSFPLGLARHSDPVRAWVTIIEGCNEYCAFCVVPYTRGHERMRPWRAIVAEAAEAARTGHREVQLLGQIVNHYQAPDDPDCDLAELLARVSAVDGIDRIRFASPHPRHVTPRLVAAIRDLPKVCRHLHLPVQSGSTRVLASMRRRYTRESYLDLVAGARAAVPGLALSTDMIVGFPGETAEDFEATLDLVRAVRYHAMYSFKYSPRPNTLAAKRLPDDVPEAEKTRRIVALQRLQQEIQAELYRAMVGTEELVLIDGRSRRRASELAGRTEGHTVVNLPGPAEWIGRLVPVRIVAAAPNSLRGEAVALPIEQRREVSHAG
jgi:tRNA-2-methylthio-N6-dimethylallyladenosine synthase